MTVTTRSPAEQIARRKALYANVRAQAQTLFDQGVPGVQIASAICSATEEVLHTLIGETCGEMGPGLMDRMPQMGSIVAIGGTGRGELAPYSDVDLLFLYNREGRDHFQEFAARFVQACWDSGMQLGHSIRDIPTCLSLAQEDCQIATALVEARCIWGNEALCERLNQRFLRRVIKARKRRFIDDCLKARSPDWFSSGPPSQELEPDIKSSSGGLRDLHLIRWIGYARYGVKDIDSLRLAGGLGKTDARMLKDALEFLTRIRIDLHLSARRAQDLLTKDEQLRIAELRGVSSSDEQRPVERFMREYFQHSSEVAAITRRFAALERPRLLRERLQDYLFGHRAEGYLFVSGHQIDVADRNLPRVCKDVESMLRTYKASALYNVPLSPRVTEAIKSAVTTLPADVSPVSARLFLDILRCTRSLGPTLRSMFSTGLLDLIIPDVTHVRNLLQFNQYHKFTVDEHTLRAIETVTSFEFDQTPVGSAYREIHNKEVLHLAVFLHDIGKGFVRDHCLVGEEIAVRIGRRLFMPPAQIEQVAQLVRKHLEMADAAFRRDITDQQLIVDFSTQVGAPDVLRMLYVLTVADVTSVGPGTWTTWKAGLLDEFYDRCLLILSGKRYSHHEAERVREAKQAVVMALRQVGRREATFEGVDRSLRGFSSYYLTTTAPSQIAQDLQVIDNLAEDRIEVVTRCDEERGISEYRVIALGGKTLTGCFHKMCGVLTAKRLEILNADINTSEQGVVVDSYSVIDPDYAGCPPPHRFEEIADTLRDVLQGKDSVEALFQRNRRFGENRRLSPVSQLPTKVKIDNDSSATRTIIDVFTYDRPGLLYTVAKVLFELNLSIDLAKIATHFDQVLDVFYVQESDGRKVKDGERLNLIRERIQNALQEFESASRLATAP